MATLKNLAVLGSTGSIGTQTLEVVRAFPDRLKVIGLAAGSNLPLLAQHIAEFKPKYISCRGETSSLSTGDAQFLSTEEMASHPDVGIVVIAILGNAALMPVLAAVKAGKVVALASKEALVSAGEIIMSQTKKTGARIRPVDSEHSAIWQCLEGEKAPPHKIILTASGGPFRNYSRADMAGVTPEMALRHPSWRMGKKVTVDSATLMNKGLEVIEAHWLFSVSFERIEVVIHPQSIVHSLVELPDGAVKAQLSAPDMRLPIQYALSYPERWGNEGLTWLDLCKTGRLDFEEPDYSRFPCLKLAVEAGRKGGTYPAVLCAADEVAIELFLAGRIKFLDIPLLVEAVLEKHRSFLRPTLEDIEQADRWARAEVLEAVRRERMHC